MKHRIKNIENNVEDVYEYVKSNQKRLINIDEKVQEIYDFVDPIKAVCLFILIILGCIFVSVGLIETAKWFSG